ncbi:hypothetical protein H0H92_004324 [Tricholoma furcatifolium]|nr:hypothetical protein H0H92_004324 [Tricholoma furcatifolium]
MDPTWIPPTESQDTYLHSISSSYDLSFREDVAAPRAAVDPWAATSSFTPSYDLSIRDVAAPHPSAQPRALISSEYPYELSSRDNITAPRASVDPWASTSSFTPSYDLSIRDVAAPNPSAQPRALISSEYPYELSSRDNITAARASVDLWASIPSVPSRGPSFGYNVTAPRESVNSWVAMPSVPSYDLSFGADVTVPHASVGSRASIPFVPSYDPSFSHDVTAPRPSDDPLAALQAFFNASPDALKADQRYHTPCKDTREPGAFDTHLHEDLRLKHVVKLPGILQDLLDNVDDALRSYPFPLPLISNNQGSPSLKSLAEANRKHREDIFNEIDVQTAYWKSVADFCAPVAATLEFQLDDWNSNGLQWARVMFSNPLPGVQRHQAVADGFLNLGEISHDGEPYHLTARQRNIFELFTVLAIWEFKNLNFDTKGNIADPKEKKAVFDEIVGGFLGDTFPWAGCEMGEDCIITHPKMSVTACRTGNDAYCSPCPSYDKERSNHPDRSYSRKKKSTVKETAAHRSAGKILQQAWAEAVARDVTFIVLSAGNIETICIRDRLTQTLYVSDHYRVGDEKYPYYKLHTGLYVAAIRDAEDRANIIKSGLIPHTWQLKTGIKGGGELDLSEVKKKENVTSKLLLEAQRRPSLIISSRARRPSRQPYSTDRYKRIKCLPPTYRLWHEKTEESEESDSDSELQDFSQESHDSEYWAGSQSNSDSEQGSSDSGSNRDLQTPPPSLEGPSFGPNSPALAETQSDVSEDNSDEVPRIDTYFKIIADESFHGLDICRGTLDVSGVKYHSSFRNADKPQVILKNASLPKDILLLEHESNVIDALLSQNIPSIPRKLGFFLSLDPQNSAATFAALVLQDKGISLDFIRQRSRFYVKQRERVEFHRLLRAIHNAGYLHGNLTQKSLLFDHKNIFVAKREVCTDISIVGYKNATSLYYKHSGPLSTPVPTTKAWQTRKKKKEHRKLRKLLHNEESRRVRTTEAGKLHAWQELCKLVGAKRRNSETGKKNRLRGKTHD